MAAETILLTGGSGFIGAHILEALLRKGLTIITTVRSQAKADTIDAAHPHFVATKRLITIPVGDIANAAAFDAVLKQHGVSLSAVVHTASPFHYKFTDAKTELIDPAVNGTLGILRAIKNHAPNVRRVVITSSFATIVNAAKAFDHSTVYTEDCWNPNTLADAGQNKLTDYRVSKTLAEHAAWDFVRNETPSFDLTTVNPPVVFGPVVHHIAAPDAINNSNERIVALLQGKWKTSIPEIGSMVLWVDVRDVAAAHIRALETPEAGSKRLFVVGGRHDNREIADIVYNAFPERRSILPGPEVQGGVAPPAESLFQIDTSKTDEVLGIQWTKLNKSITDLVGSLKSINI